MNEVNDTPDTLSPEAQGLHAHFSSLALKREALEESDKFKKYFKALGANPTDVVDACLHFFDRSQSQSVKREAVDILIKTLPAMLLDSPGNVITVANKVVTSLMAAEKKERYHSDQTKALVELALIGAHRTTDKDLSLHTAAWIMGLNQEYVRKNASSRASALIGGVLAESAKAFVTAQHGDSSRFFRQIRLLEKEANSSSSPLPLHTILTDALVHTLPAIDDVKDLMVGTCILGRLRELSADDPRTLLMAPVFAKVEEAFPAIVEQAPHLALNALATITSYSDYEHGRLLDIRITDTLSSLPVSTCIGVYESTDNYILKRVVTSSLVCAINTVGSGHYVYSEKRQRAQAVLKELREGGDVGAELAQYILPQNPRHLQELIANIYPAEAPVEKTPPCAGGSSLKPGLM